MIKRSDIETSVRNYKATLDKPFQLKGIFFDMDGVLFNSMPYHVKAWAQTFEEHQFEVPEIEFYLNEGSTALATVSKLYSKYRGEVITPEFAEEFRVRKHKLMENFPESKVLPFMKETLEGLTGSGIECWVVTGSAQIILLDRLEREFKGSVKRERMVTAFDVKIGKPHPEPYLKAMKKSGFDCTGAIVVENAPMGIESAKAAGLFVVAINTGPLDPECLKEADLVLSGSEELAEWLPTIIELFQGNA